jgi:hypothetical protein
MTNVVRVTRRLSFTTLVASLFLGIGCSESEVEPTSPNVASGGLANAGSGGAGGGGAGAGGAGAPATNGNAITVDCFGMTTCVNGEVRATTSTSVTYPQACPVGEVVYQCPNGCRTDMPQSGPPETFCEESAGAPEGGTDAGNEGQLDAGTDAGIPDSGAAEADAAD